MKRTQWIVLIVGLSIVLVVGNWPVHSQDTEAESPAEGKKKGIIIDKGVVSDGEKIPIPDGLRRDEVTIMLSLRNIDDHAQVSAKIQCYVADDGTASVRSVRKFPQSSTDRATAQSDEPAVLDRGKATYLLLARK